MPLQHASSKAGVATKRIPWLFKEMCMSSREVLLFLMVIISLAKSDMEAAGSTPSDDEMRFILFSTVE